jgi:hypothetical protein
MFNQTVDDINLDIKLVCDTFVIKVTQLSTGNTLVKNMKPQYPTKFGPDGADLNDALAEGELLAKTLEGNNEL